MHELSLTAPNEECMCLSISVISQLWYPSEVSEEEDVKV